jgi:hypothetical protein
MRRSSVVQLTLLPMLATAAAASLAAADPPGATAPASAPEMPAEYGPPSEAPIELMPPGMTPGIDDLACEDDPNWRLRPDCPEEDDVYYYGADGAIRGGFGTYFYGGGGG